MTITITYDITFTSNITPITGDVANVAASSLGTGGYVVAADDGLNTVGQVFDSTGSQIFANGFRVGGTRPALAGLASGNIVMVTQDIDSIVYRIRDPNGNFVSNAVDIGDTGSSNADVTALQNGGFAIVSQDLIGGDTDLDIAFFNSTGALQLGFGVSGVVGVNERDAAITTLDNGNIVVTWERTSGADTQVWMAIYTQTGGAVLGNTLVDNFGSFNANPQVVATDAGFAIFYEDDEWDTFAPDITMARFNSTGGLLGFTNASNPGLAQDGLLDSNVQVTRLPGGFLAIAYEVAFADQDVRMRVLADDGSSVSGPVAIVGEGGFLNDQTNPDLAFFGTSGIAAFADDSGTGIEGEVNTVRIIHTSDAAADTMLAGQLFDRFIGGAGDRISYANSTAAVTVNLGTSTANGGYATGDSFAGIANLTGSAFGDTLTGDGAANTLNGGLGADTLLGGTGNDVYFVDQQADRVVETSGQGSDDRIAASASYALAAGLNIEVLLTTSFAGTTAINLTGNALAQRIIGNAGANRLEDGLGAADIMTGGAGNDVYGVRNADTLIVEGAGGGTIDGVFAAVSFVLAADDAIELLATTSVAGTAAINLTGNGFAQRIFGNAAANRLESGAGAADTLIGGGGNDTYFVRNSATLIVENAGFGAADSVGTSVSFALAADDNIEALTAIPATGTTAINLTGNALAQRITGNAGANSINGGAGLDTLTGGAGADRFVFNTTPGAANVDRITDFTVGVDKIVLENLVFPGLLAGPLPFSGFAATLNGLATDPFDRIIYETDTGKLFYDFDGNGLGPSIQFAVISPGLIFLGATDFVII